MCTLAVAVQPREDTPLLVAANRDESLHRPARPPFVWPGTPRILAPRDEQAHGTWVGLNAHGLFVGITNRYPTVKEAARESRGILTLEALGQPSAAALHAHLATLSPQRFNAFHLLYADRSSAHVTWSDGMRVHQLDLAPGLHVITERSFGAEEVPREAWVRAHWPADAIDDPQRLETLLATHGRADAQPLEVPCVHVPGVDYGTRSSMVLKLGRTWQASRLSWAEGPPCTAPFQDLGGCLASLA